MRQLFLSDIFDIIYFEVCLSWYANLNFSLIGLIFGRIFDVPIEMFVQRGDNSPLYFNNIKVRIDKKTELQKKVWFFFQKILIIYKIDSIITRNLYDHYIRNLTYIF